MLLYYWWVKGTFGKRASIRVGFWYTLDRINCCSSSFPFIFDDWGEQDQRRAKWLFYYTYSILFDGNGISIYSTKEIESTSQFTSNCLRMCTWDFWIFCIICDPLRKRSFSLYSKISLRAVSNSVNISHFYYFLRNCHACNFIIYET